MVAGSKKSLSVQDSQAVVDNYIARLGEAADHKELKTLLEAFSLINILQAPDLVRRVDSLISQIGWLEPELALRGLQTRRLKASLEVALALPKSDEQYSLLGMTEATGLFQAVVPLGQKAPPADIEQLRAALALAVLDAQLGRTNTIGVSKTQLDEFASKVRAFASTRAGTVPGYIRLAIASAEGAQTLAAFGAALKDEFLKRASEIKPGDLADIWINRWFDWSQVGEGRTPLASPSLGSPQSDTEPRQPALPRSSGVKRTIHPKAGVAPDEEREGRAPVVRTIRLPKADPPPNWVPEPESESAPEITVVTESKVTDAGKEPPVKRVSAAAARGQLQRRNQDFHLSSIDTLSAAESAGLVPVLMKAVEADIYKDIGGARLGLIALATLATGRSVLELATCPVGPEHVESANSISISTKKGTIRFKALSLRDIFTPEDHFKSCFHEPGGWIELPLPPRLARLLVMLPLGPLCVDHGAESQESAVTLSTAAVESLERRVNRYIRKSVDPNLLQPSVSRMRRRGVALIHNFGGDFSQTALITGTDHGRSDAPLYYYSPLAHVFKQAYVDAVWPEFQDAQISVPPSEQRLGPAWLLKATMARRFVKTISGEIPRKVSLMSHAVGMQRVHKAITDHVVSMTMQLTTHRPTNALFELTLHDFDLLSHSSVLQDKKVDPAHWVRFAATTPAYSRQLNGYLDHLYEMSQFPDATVALRERIRLVLVGDAPLFFTLDQELNPRPLTINSWYENLPLDSLAAGFPANWYRASQANVLRENGVEPYQVLWQLGHVEAAGFPANSASAVAPIEMAKALHKPLAAWAEDIGWRVYKGFGEGRYVPRDHLGPLRSWTAAFLDLNKRQRQIQAKYKIAVRSKFREERQNGEKIALKVINRVRPELAEDLRMALENGPLHSSHSTRELGTNETIKILELVEIETGSNPVSQVATQKALSKFLRKANRELGWIAPDFSVSMPVSTPEPSPFFPGMMVATQQMEIMRSHFCSLPPAHDGLHRYARAYLSLVLFSPVRECENIQAVLASIRNAGRLRNPTDLLLVTTASGVTWGFRGLAALHLLALKDDLEASLNPDHEALVAALKSLIPEGLRPSKDLFVALEGTAQVAAIIEENGLARSAFGLPGSTAAEFEVQRAFFENNLPRVDHLEKTSAYASWIESPQISRASGSTLPRTVKEARAQYDELMSIVSMPPGQRKHFDRINQSAMPEPRRKAKELATAEVKAWLNEIGDQACDVVHCLAGYAIQLLEKGTRTKEDPAFSTISTYLSDIGGGLIEFAGDLDFWDMSGEDFTDLYSELLTDAAQRRAEKHKRKDQRDKVGSSIGRIAGQLVEFHMFLMGVRGVESIDFSEFGPYFNRRNHGVRADLFTQEEFKATVRALMRRLKESDSSEDRTLSESRRIDRLAIVAMILLYASGARIGEISRLLFRHIIFSRTPEGRRNLVICIRPSRFSGIKTHAGNRLVNCTDVLDDEQFDLVVDWITSERTRLGEAGLWAKPIFSMAGSGDDVMPIKAETLREIIKTVSAAVVGRPLIPHLLRHSYSTATFLAISALPRSSAFSTECLRPQGHQHEGFSNRYARNPRIAREKSRMIGHADVATSLASYQHTPWAFWNGYGIDRVDRISLSGATGIKLQTIDTIGQRSRVQIEREGQIFSKEHWLEAVMSGLLSMPKPRSGIAQFDGIPMTPCGTPISCREFADLLRQSRNESEFWELASGIGLPSGAIQSAIDQIRHLFELRGYRLIDLHSGTSTAKSGRSPRRFKEAEPLYQWFDWILEPRVCQTYEIVERISGLMSDYFNKGANSLQLPMDRANDLELALKTVGFASSSIVRAEVEPSAYASETISLLRKPAIDSEISVPTDRNQTQNTLNAQMLWSLAVLWVFSRWALVKG